MKYTSPQPRIELTTLVVIGTECICKSNYHTFTATSVPCVKNCGIYGVYANNTWQYVRLNLCVSNLLQNLLATDRILSSFYKHKSKAFFFYFNQISSFPTA